MRTEGSSRDKTWPIIRRSALGQLSKHGFHGMNLRNLASDSGLQAGSLYNYFKNKDELLVIIMREIMQELLDKISEAEEHAKSPEERLDKFVEVMVGWHAKRRKEAMISQSELRSLTKAGFREIVDIRKKFEVILLDIILDGVETGVFSVGDPKLSANMLINMLTSISYWYKAGGRLSVATMIVEYQSAARRVLGNSS
ncbi:TetR/AcrR family transcriptional regulator [Hoeflea alexandrii]|uniref:TetR/AcrR family transcriptional regulator n=1 Tax=Hoeflea alexandrii TaxID=288436 RepID=UPI0022AF8CEA|nr:TetR/AcrR family transcriptional regulator [Hoeflea alexandrii]MCZ4291562.1 TetR/AcrR family transcriptional regulator [Hoeflea alexandrii]